MILQPPFGSTLCSRALVVHCILVTVFTVGCAATSHHEAVLKAPAEATLVFPEHPTLVTDPTPAGATELTVSIGLPGNFYDQYRSVLEQTELAFVPIREKGGHTTVENHTGETLSLAMEQPSAGSGSGTSWVGAFAPFGLVETQGVAAKLVADALAKSAAIQEANLAAQISQQAVTVVTQAEASGARVASSASRLAPGTVVRVVMGVIRAATPIVISYAAFRLIESFDCDTFWHATFWPFLDMMGMLSIDCYEEIQRHIQEKGFLKMLAIEAKHIGVALGLVKAAAVAEGIDEAIAILELPGGGLPPHWPPTKRDKSRCRLETGTAPPFILNLKGATPRFSQVINQEITNLRLSAPARLHEEDAATVTTFFDAGSKTHRTVVDVYEHFTGRQDDTFIWTVRTKMAAVNNCPGTVQRYKVLLKGGLNIADRRVAYLQSIGFSNNPTARFVMQRMNH